MLVPPPPLKYPRVSAVGHSRWSPSDSPAVVAFHWRLLNKRQRPLGRSAEDPHRLLHLWHATAVGTGGWRFHSAVLAGIPISSYKRSRNQTIVALGLPSMLTSQHFSAVGDRLTRQKVHHKVTGGFSLPPKLPRHTSSVALQFRSFGSVERLREQIGRVVPSTCSCSTTAPSSSTDTSVISWNGRSPAIVAEKSWNAKTSGLANCSKRACTVFVCSGVKIYSTSFLSSEFGVW